MGSGADGNGPDSRQPEGDRASCAEAHRNPGEGDQPIATPPIAIKLTATSPMATSPRAWPNR